MGMVRILITDGFRMTRSGRRKITLYRQFLREMTAQTYSVSKRVCLVEGTIRLSFVLQAGHGAPVIAPLVRDEDYTIGSPAAP